MGIFRFFVCLFLLLLSSASFGVESSPPVLTLFSMDKANIDVSDSDQIVSFTIEAEDESGIDWAKTNIEFNDPTGNSYYLHFSAEAPHVATFEFSSNNKSGLWRVGYIRLTDTFDNGILRYASTFESNRLLEVTGGVESNPPTLTSFSMDKANIDISESDQIVSFTIEAEDESGIDWAKTNIEFNDPTGNSYYLHFSAEAPHVATFEFSSNNKSGLWRVGYIRLTDTFDNGILRYASTFESNTLLEVTGGVESNPPTLTSFSMDKANIDISESDQIVSFTIEAEDESGIDWAKTNIEFNDPTGNSYYLHFSAEAPHVASFSVDCESKIGLWRVGYIRLTDTFDNGILRYASTFESNTLIEISESDTDLDGIVNCDDTDDDNDGISDEEDPFPNQPSYLNDTDNDGLPDEWEDANGFNKYNYTDAASDNDNDGLTALEEYNLGTSPNKYDTDRDTLPDGWEVENGRDPTKDDYKVSAGYDTECAIDDNGVHCWGYGDSGQTTVPTDLMNPVILSSGKNGHICALDDNGVHCWGYNGFGATDVPTLENPMTVSAGGWHTCAIDDNGVQCWGGTHNIIQAVPEGLVNPVAVSAGNSHTCALDDNGVHCWGLNDRNQIDVPSDLLNPVAVSAGWTHTCALDDNGVNCWGDVYQPDFWAEVTVPPSLENPVAVSAGKYKTCALDDNGVQCWGGNSPNFIAVPEDLKNPVAVSAGSSNICALDANGVHCWGFVEDARTAVINSLMFDPDEDGYSNQNGEDAFPFDSSEWVDTDLDGIGNNADIDDDNDGINDTEDTSPLVPFDTDADGVSDNKDAFPNNPTETVDSDADGIGDNTDNCLETSNSNQLNTDGDEFGDACDSDDDNDGIQDLNDDLPLDATEQLDTDGDGVGNNADFDDDNDGFEDVSDAFPLSQLYHADSDSDGMADSWEILYGLNPNDPLDTISDKDYDGFVALQEFIEGTIPGPETWMSWDFDEDGIADALTDGLLLLRYTFHLTDEILTDGVISPLSSLTTAEVQAKVAATTTLFADIDDNGDVDALTDGLLLLRYLFGLRGDQLLKSALSNDANRDNAEDIEGYIQSLMPRS